MNSTECWQLELVAAGWTAPDALASRGRHPAATGSSCQYRAPLRRAP